MGNRNELVQHSANMFYLYVKISVYTMTFKLFYGKEKLLPALFSLMMLVFLCIGCNKNQGYPSTSDLLGKWYIEFHEEEFGGDCFVEYSFRENGELTLTMVYSGEKFEIPMLWHTEEGVLYAIEKDAEEFYEEENLNWTGISYKINGNTLEFYNGGKLTASFAKKN